MELLDKLFNQARFLHFNFLYAPRFLSCGKKSVILAPFRIDGYESIILGDGVVLQSNCWLYCNPINDTRSPVLTIGNRSTLGFNNHITSVNKVIIEEDVLTANNVYISDNVHEYSDVTMPIIKQPIRFQGSVRIGKGSWLGENVCVIGASVGRNSVVGANAVVTSDIPDYSVAVGVPARVIRQYDFYQKCWVEK